MSNEEAIETIEVIKAVITGNPNVVQPEFFRYCEVLSLASEALEKQIPKEPMRHIMVGNIGISGNWCPICEWGVHKKYDSVDGNNCPNCGQAIDWSDSKNKAN